MPESKSKFLIPAVGAAVFVAGSIAAYMYFKGPSGDASGALSSAKVVPDKALMATYITTDPQVWGKLQQFGTPEAQKLVTKNLQDLNKDLFSDSNISYEKDLKPWVGGVMIALLPTNPVKPAQFNVQVPQGTPTPNVPVATKTEQPNVLMVVGIKDKIAALNFGKKLKEDKTLKTKDIDYKGEKISETTGKGEPTYSAVLNNTYVVFAQKKQAVEQAIDTIKGQPSFASIDGASSILSKGVDVQNTLAQIYVPDYPRMVQQLLAANPQSAALSPETLKQLKQVKSMVAGVGVDDAGVRMKAIANVDSQMTKFQYQDTPAKVVSQFPSDTIALVSGQGISRWWTAVVEQSKDYPEFKQAVEETREQLKTRNIDLDKDIFSWMNGEFGFAAIQSNQGLLSQVGFGGALIFDTSDRKTAEATFTKLDTLAKTQSLSVAGAKIGTKDVTQWQIPGGGALVSHGWLDQDTVFLAFGGPIADTLVAPKGQSLDNSDSFKAVTGSLKKPNGGYFYLDMDKTATLLNRFAAAQPIAPETTAILNSIRGLGVTANSTDKSTTQVEMLLALKPKTPTK